MLALYVVRRQTCAALNVVRHFIVRLNINDHIGSHINQNAIPSRRSNHPQN